MVIGFVRRGGAHVSPDLHNIIMNTTTTTGVRCALYLDAIRKATRARKRFSKKITKKVA